MQFVDVSGVGNSGKSALVDLLREYEGVWAPSYSFEFDFLRVPGGLIELGHWTSGDWSPIRSHAAYLEFCNVASRMGLDPAWWNVPGLMRCSSHRYDRVFKKRFTALALAFADSLVVGSYRAEWPYDTFRDSNATRFTRKVASRLGFRRQLARTVFMIDGRNFSESATRFMEELFGAIVAQGTSWTVLNNGFEPFNPVPHLDMIRGSRQIVVTRDPRDTYVTGQNAHAVAVRDQQLLPADNDGMNKSFLATDDLEAFIARYRLYHRHLYQGDDPRVMRVRFEDLVREPQRIAENVSRFLGIASGRHRQKGTFFSPERSAKGVGVWRDYSKQDAICHIERELEEFLVQ